MELVVVRTDWSGKDLKGIVAIRKHWDKAVEVLAHAEHQFELEPLEHLETTRSPRHAESKFFDHGLFLHDPSRPPLMADFVSTTESVRSNVIRSAITKKPSLPPEIKEQICDALRKPTSLDDETDAPSELAWDSLQVELHLTRYLTNAQLRHLQESINKGLNRIHPEMSCILHTWRSFEPANRQDILRLWQRLLDHNLNPRWGISMILLDPLLYRMKSVLGLITHKKQGLLEIREVNLTQAFEAWRAMENIPYQRHLLEPLRGDCGGRRLEEMGDGKMFCDPTKPFYTVWHPWIEHPDADRNNATPPVFILTNKYTEAGMRALRTELSTFDPGNGDTDEFGPKHYAMVPWSREFDATEEDMWNLLYMCHSTKGQRIGPSQIVCIDRQSFRDKTVILADLW